MARVFEDMKPSNSKQDDLVSVVIPVWNVCEYLPYCLDTVLRQSYSNLEVILVDDGSDDGSELLCDQVALKDERVSVIHQNNGGLSAARNAGTLAAHGDWLLFIDSDDYVSEKYIERLLTAAKQNSADCALCMFRVTNRYQAVDNSHDNAGKAVGSVEVLPSEEAVMELLSERKASTSAWAKLAKTELWKKHLFPESRRFEDLPVSWKVLADSSVVAIVSPPMYWYVKRDNSITKSFSADSIHEYWASINQIYKEIPQRFPSAEMAKCLCFRVCLECCRLFKMCFTARREPYEKKCMQEDIVLIKMLMRKCMRLAVRNTKAPLLQRFRIFLTAIIPSFMSQI